MRVLLLNQFYPPDTAPTGEALHDLAGILAQRGHDVHVVCSRDSYGGVSPAAPETAGRAGVAVHRLGGAWSAGTGLLRKGAGYASFAARLALAARGLPHPDVVVALTTPPWLGSVASAVPAWRRVPRVDWVMDVYPDALCASGLLRRGGLPFQRLEAISRRQLRGAAAVVALGPFMARALAPRGGDEVRLDVVPLGGDAPLGPPDGDAVAEARRSHGWAPEDLVLLYSGNMGRGHRVAEFLEAAGRLGPAGPRWVFRGGGPRRAEVEGFRQGQSQARVEVLSYVPRAARAAHLAAADVHLASLSAPWQGLIVPSKVQAAFATARPLIFVGPAENEVAAWTRESGGGWVVPEGDVPGLLAAVEQARDAGERARRGQAALAFARDHFDPAQNTERMARIVERAGVARG